MRLSRMILFFLIGVFVAHCTFYYPNLPAQMVSHFGLHGEPNGWMQKESFFVFEAIILIVIILQFTFLPALTGNLPLTFINMPNREYWFSAERRDETLKILRHYFEWFSVALLALFIGINQLVFRANLSGENLSANSWLILGVFLIFVIGWLIKFTRQFKLKS